MARQLLLHREQLAPAQAVDHLVGLQAQEPLDPYLALWSRLVDFDPDELGQAIEDRQVVRIVAMRATVHLLTADDALELRPLCQPVLTAELARHRDFAPPLRDLDLGPMLDVAAAAHAEQPMRTRQLRVVLAERFPHVDATALAYACRNHLALVQVPPRGVWGRKGQVTLTTAESWVGRPLATAPSIEDAVRRYLSAFGPALPADVATWSRLIGFREVLNRMRPTLRTFRDDRGRELFDVPEAPLPDPDTPAPARLLPMYDNAVLSHADRTRYTPDTPIIVEAPVHGSVLHDGFLCGTWSIEHLRDGVALTVRHRALPSQAVDDVLAEAARALAFLEPSAACHDVRSESIKAR